ncbi:MAG: Hpt domain-containing protein [Planctomycetales bacterium]|nr:Hpt domain-containing protein [Planctomycetales bacterium]
MAKNIAPEVIRGFVAEAGPQLESIQNLVQRFQADRSQHDVIQDARRAAHRIKGESSMIGLSEFSHLAYSLENLLDQLGGECDRGDELLGTSFRLVELLGQYVVSLESNRFDQDAIREGILAYRRCLQLPEQDDEAELRRMLGDSVDNEDTTDATTDESAHTRHAVDAAQWDNFRHDVADRLQVITDLLHDPDNLEEEDVQQIRRALHSVKGCAGVLGVQTVADLAHACEDYLQRLSDDGSEFSANVRALLLQSIDTICEVVEGTAPSTDLSELHRRLGSSVAGEDDAAEKSEPTPRAHVVSQEALDAIRADLDHVVSEELLSVFREEAEDHIKQLYNGLNSLQTAMHDRDHLQAIRRSAHTLKGAAGAVGMRVVTKLSHRMEDLLDLLYEGGKEMTQEILVLLLDTTDRLHDLSFDAFDKDDQLSRVVQLYCQYADLLEHRASDAAPSEIVLSTQMAGGGAANLAAEPDGDEQRRGQQQREKFDRRVNDQMLRVPMSRVDELVRTVSELIINRTTFEQRMADFVRCVEELRPALGRLRGVSTELETRYSVDELRSQSRRKGRAGHSVVDESRFDEFDTLEFDRYNEFHLMARSVSEATNDVNTVTNELRTLIGDFDSLLVRQDRLSRDTQDRLMRIRMVPLAALATRLHRAVRVVATNQGKRVELVIEGEDTELDKSVLEEIADPLLHLLRNAVDHGAEPPDLRMVKGKSEQATIRIRAFYQGTQVVLRISDDGSGLDPKRIAQAAVNRGHLSQAEAESLTAQEIFPYIFVPGLSTATQISEVSGRGVGMDIVRDKVQRLKGTITVDSELDKGTTFTIRLPMTLAVTRALLVVAGNELFAVPMQSVVQIARLDREQIDRLGNEPVIRLDGTACPLIKLSELLNLREVEDDGRGTVPVFIVRAGEKQVAVRVERILSGRDIVVKTLGTHLRKVHGLVGATLLGDGTIVPILDPNAMVTSEKPAVPLRTRSTSGGRDTATNIMIVDDSVSVRRVMENLVHSQGWLPLVAKDGLDAIELLQSVETPPDVFLLDIEMPRMDGFELLSTLRSMPQYRDKPIIMVTSRAGEKHRAKALSLGATEYVVKPYQDDQLIAIIKRLRDASKESLLV